MKPTHLLLALAAIAALSAPAARASDHGEAERKANKAVARRVFDEVLTRGNTAVADELYASDFVVHGAGRDYSRAEDAAAAKGWRDAFPDLVMRPEMLIAEDDLVAIRWTATGTNTGTGNGLPATGKHVTSTGVTIFRFAGGKIVEEWSTFDMLGLMTQLGLAPASGR
jgi:steroid delta-isomerase-like uncharacterized protein